VFDCYLVKTRAKQVQRSHIQKYGFISDKAHPPLATSATQGGLKKKKAYLEFPTNPRWQRRQDPAPGQHDAARVELPTNPHRQQRHGPAFQVPGQQDASQVLDHMLGDLMGKEQLQVVQVEIEDAGCRLRNIRTKQEKFQVTGMAGDGDGRTFVAPRAAHGHLRSAQDPNFDQSLARIASSRKPLGHCVVAGCSYPNLELDHKCRTCGKFVHNFCAQENELKDDDIHYCCLCCKPRS
jgi:hypothetical protein